MERLNKINEVGGLHDMLQIPPELLDEDWDPEKHEVRLIDRKYGYDKTPGSDDCSIW